MAMRRGGSRARARRGSANDSGGAGALSKETQQLLDKMMKDAGLNRRQMAQIQGGVSAGGGLPSDPGQVTRHGNEPRYAAPPGTQLGGSAWAGLGSMGAPSRYTDSRGRVKDLDEFTDWRSVRLPPQRKSRTAILGELNCGPAGRPIPEPYRPMPQIGPSREEQKETLIKKMAYGDQPPPEPAPAPLPAAPVAPTPEPDSMDEFLDTVKQIEEREQWMRDMKKLGKLEYESESRVKVEIAERVARMKVSPATVGLGSRLLPTLTVDRYCEQVLDRKLGAAS